MALNYQVHLTATAELDYGRYCEQSDSSSNDGKISGPIVSIDKAIDETLAVSPISAAFLLAGSLSFIFMLNLGRICIYYIAYAEHGITHVLHIGDSQDGNDLSWLHEAVKNGQEEAEAMLEKLG